MRAIRLIIGGLMVSLAPLLAQTTGPVRQLGITATYGISAQIFDEVVNLDDLEKGAGFFVATTLANCQKRAEQQGRSAQSIANLRGNWLEYALLLALKHHGLTPAYWQAQFNAVPNAYNDVMVWSTEHGPVIISCKTSLRERYKQADLEAVALKAHHPNAKFYLLTLDADKTHVARVRRKISEGEIIALQAIYDETNLDELVAFLKTLTLTEPPATTLRSAKAVR
jgi:hypothetical protein